MKANWKKYSFRFAVMVILLALFLRWIDIFNSYHHFSDVNWIYLYYAMGVIFCVCFFKAVRFYFLTKAIQLQLPFWKSIWVNNMTLIVGRLTPGKLGEGVKVFFLQAKNTELSFCFAMEKLIDIITVFIFALLGISLFSDFVSSYLLFGIVIVGAIFCLYHLDKILKFLFKKNILEDKWFISNVKKFKFIDWVHFLILSVIIRGGILTLPFLVNLSLGITTPWLLVFEMYAIAIMLGNLSALPGGFGAREGTYTVLLSTTAGITTSLAGVVSLLITFVDLVIESILSIVGYIVVKFCYDKK